MPTVTLQYAAFHFQRWLNSDEIAAMPWDVQGFIVHLMCRAWADDDCSIPDDDLVLAKWAGVPLAEWLRIDPIGSHCHPNGTPMRQFVRSYFSGTSEGRRGPRLFNARQRELHEETLARMEKQSLSGRKGAENRWGKRVKSQDGVAMAPQCDPIGGRNGTPMQGKERKGKEREHTPKAPKGASEPVGFAEFWDTYPSHERKVDRAGCARAVANAVAKGPRPIGWG